MSLRDDAARPSAPDFLTGGGEMGALMRAHDWSASPLGVPEAWPQSLRTAVSLMINSKHPMFIAWGPELAFLYNDGYVPIFGAKHPDALGLPFARVWSEIWDDIRPLVDRALAGEATWSENFHLVMERNGFPEDTWYTFSYSPVRDESGGVAGMFCACTETTKAVCEELRREALLTLDERLRDVAGTADLSFAASELLGEALGASRVGYGIVDFDAVTITIERNWFAPGFDDLVGVHRFADYGSHVDDLRQGRAVAIADVTADLRTAANAAAFRSLGVRAFLDMPVVENGRIVGLMFVHSASPRAWTNEEAAFVRDFAERARAAIARRAAEQELLDSEARFRALATVGSAAVYRMSPDWREMRWLDGGGFVADSEEPTIDWETYIPPQERPRVRVAIEEAIRTKGVFELEHRVLRADGTVGWTFSRAIPLLDEAGEIVEWFGAGSDVTDRVKAGEAFTRLFEASPAPFLVVRPDAPRFTIAEVNDAYLAATMRERGDLIGRGIFEAFPDNPDDGTIRGVSKLRASLEHTLASRRPNTLPDLKYDIPRPDGTFEERWWSPVNSPVLDDNGEVEAIIHNAIDVTEDRRMRAALHETQVRLLDLNETLEMRVAERTTELEQAHERLRQSQKLESMGQLTGGVAHDLNNLLTPIMGSLDLLRRRGLGSEREQRMIDGALQSAERARLLVQRLLAFARRQPLQAVAVDVAALVAGMADLIDSTSGPRVRVEIDLAPNLPPAKADANQLELAILNLAVNACDAMAEGGTLTIVVKPEAVGPGHRTNLAPGDYVRLTVADTGTGMDGATLARAIEPFFSTKGVGKGTGLGLSMVHGLAAQLGGALAVSSKPGLGTAVDLWLSATADEVRLAGRPVEAEPLRFAGTALLVDDEELVRASTADMLADLGYAVVETSSAEMALQMIDEGLAFDLLVSDHLMPGMTGTDLARRLRGTRPDVRVLIVSGYAEVEGIAPDLPRLTKPYQRDDLAAKLSEIEGPA